MNRHRHHLAAFGVAIAMLAGLCAPAPAADLSPYKAAPRYYALPAPSPPCVEYRRIYTDALYSARQVARLFRRHDREFLRLKRTRRNDGFDGPDIRVNAVMSSEQIDAAVLTTRVEIFVAKARQLSCASPARLNQIDNEASRLDREIAQAAIWIDPQSFR
jgi:hypothetical protein